MSIQWLGYVATALVLTAVYYISKPLLRGQLLIVAADILWLVYSILTHQWALTLQSVALLFIGFTAIRNWNRKNIPL